MMDGAAGDPIWFNFLKPSGWLCSDRVSRTVLSPCIGKREPQTLPPTLHTTTSVVNWPHTSIAVSLCINASLTSLFQQFLACPHCNYGLIIQYQQLKPLTKASNFSVTLVLANTIIFTLISSISRAQPF